MKSGFMIVLLFVMCVLSSAPEAFAQWDLRGCSQYAVSTANPESLESSLWTFRSNVWDGYIDFQEGGKYMTHWGFGTWSVNPDGETIHLANDYNDKTYEIAFTDSGTRYQGMRNDGLVISGLLICAKYQGPGPQVPQEVTDEIIAFYKTQFEREPDKNELIAQDRLFVQGKTMEEIKDGLMQTTEYKKKSAARAAHLRELEEKGQLTW